MAKRGIRQLALILALVNAMSVSGAKAEDYEHTFYYLDEDNKLRMTDNREFIAQEGKTYVEDGDIITIFDEGNIGSKQYGASQTAFKDNFNSLIKNKYVWDILQENLEIGGFPSEQYAMHHYKFLFSAIAGQGCGLAGYADAIFKAFEGREDEFEEAFGYPMYVINEDGTIDYNYEPFMLQIFFDNVFRNDTNGEKKRTIMIMFDKSVKKEILEDFMKSDAYNIEDKSWADIRELPVEEQLDYVEKRQNKDYMYGKLCDEYENARDHEYYFQISQYIYEGHIKEFLAIHGIEADIDIRESKDFEPGDIIASDVATVYKVDEKGRRYAKKTVGGRIETINGEEKMSAHAIYVTDIVNGRIIVSNWGDKYFYDNSKANWVLRIRVKIKSNNKTLSR